MNEMLILVDGEDQAIGVGEKMQVHQQGLLHRAFSVFVFDAQGRWLLQRRADGKYHSGGLWSNSCCGHPREGEAIDAAARRRLGEEMGFECELRHVARITYRLDVSDGLIEHEYDHVFVGGYDGRPQPDPAEASDWAWKTLPELWAALAGQPQDFSRWLRHIAEQVGRAEFERWQGLATR
ncbi:isopentenyl-diphosphate Delta-isomerase [Lysobacter sp. CA196]|uniref:isopentenyl-diphosphate Delta-isomerase n=1 Tax=Lysobacter sp. CA196 TaxID=3455606 RepID=UPI003F8D1E04